MIHNQGKNQFVHTNDIKRTIINILHIFKKTWRLQGEKWKTLKK